MERIREDRTSTDQASRQNYQGLGPGTPNLYALLDSRLGRYVQDDHPSYDKCQPKDSWRIEGLPKHKPRDEGCLRPDNILARSLASPPLPDPRFAGPPSG